MQTTLNHLSTSQQANLTALLGTIIKAVQPAKIICYGYHINSQHHWRPLLQESIDGECITYDLLVLTHSNESRSPAQLLDILDKTGADHAAAACIIHKQDAVNGAIANGSRFFSAICQFAVLLYDATGEALAVPSRRYEVADLIAAAATHWNRQFARASSFYKGAAYYQSLHEGEAAVFCLHQSVEQMAMAVLKAITGYKVETHNLARLFVLLDQLGFQASAAFPNNSAEEKDLMNTLKNAYSASRYAEEYTISPQTAEILFNRVGKLLQQAEAFYTRVTQSWQSRQDREYPLSIAFVNTLHPAS